MNKRAKFLFTAIAAAGLATFGILRATHAQENPDRITVNLSDPSRPAVIHASLVNGGITVKTGDTKQVLVEAQTRNEGQRQRTPRHDAGESTEGMHRLQMGSTGLTVEEENNQVRISSESYARTIDLTITVPRQSNLHLQCVNSGNIVITGVDGEFDLNDVNGSITLEDVSGSAVAHALNGKVLAKFNRLSGKPLGLSSMNGPIDLTLPSDIKANVTIKCDQGEVFSDFDIQMAASSPQQIVEDNRNNGGKYRVRIDKAIHGMINGGGPEIQLTDFQGNIYIRKAGAR